MCSGRAGSVPRRVQWRFRSTESAHLTGKSNFLLPPAVIGRDWSMWIVSAFTANSISLSLPVATLISKAVVANAFSVESVTDGEPRFSLGTLTRLRVPAVRDMNIHSLSITFRLIIFIERASRTKESASASPDTTPSPRPSATFMRT